MAQDPKSLPNVIEALLLGAGKDGLHEDVRKHLGEYIKENHGNLAVKLPEWRATAMQELGLGRPPKDIENSINDSRFDIFNEKNIKAITQYSDVLERTLNSDEKMTVEEAQQKAISLTTALSEDLDMYGDKSTQMYQSLIKATYGTFEAAKLVTAPVAEKPVAEKPVAGKPVAGKPEAEKPEAEKPKEELFKTEKNEAAQLLKDATKSLKTIAQYGDKIPGKNTGIGELITVLKNKGTQAEQAIKTLEEQGKDNLADGIASINKNDVAPAIATLIGKQEEINKLHGKLETRLETIKTKIDQIDKLNNPADEGKMKDFLTEIRKQAEIIEQGGKGAKETLDEAGDVAKKCIGRLHNNNEFNHYYVSHTGDFEKSMKDFGGEHGLLNQWFGGGPSGQPSAFKSGLNTVYNGVASVGDWWHDVKAGARTQKERNMLNLTEQVVCGFGGLLALNMVDKLLFGGQMPGVVKWGIVIGIVGALLHRSGKTGAEMNDYAEAKMRGSSQNTGRHMLKVVPKNRPVSEEQGNTPRTIKPEDMLPKDAKGHTLKDITAEYHLAGVVNNQSANGGTPKLQPAFVVKMPGEDKILKVNPQFRDAIQAEVDKHVRNELVGKNLEELSARMQGTGKSLPNDLAGDVTIDKINGVELGEKAFTVHYTVGKGIVENMVREQQAAAEQPLQETGS